MIKKTIVFAMMLLAISATSANTTHKKTQEMFKVTTVAPVNGSYTVAPEIPEDGMVAAGTEITITATPASGYSLDAVYYTFKGGMWGTTSVEGFTPTMKITVDKDMSVGAVFVESNLVENLNVTHDVVYAQPGVKPLKYDVYSPKGAKDLPIVVIVHGGGWSSNNEDIMRGLARELLTDNHYVVFSIDYRWVNNLDGDETPNSMHNLIEDVFGAIAHIQEHAAEYGGDPTQIAVTGDSAGGHLSASAALLSTMIGDRGFSGTNGVYEFMPSYMPHGKTVETVKREITDAIKVAAPSYGPVDAANFKQFMKQTDQAYYDAVSPIKHVPNIGDRAIPHFIVRGTEDPLIPKEIVQAYVDVLKKEGQTVEYFEVQDAGHAFFDWKPDAQTRATFAKYGIPYAEEMKSFFDSVFY
ncbi:alpha/beta fold hydrolase [Flagellimonas zhangzhouensis]|uniref:Acetyl esterase/lipase n=1 Tax=Flagellimonas zhangzhouensis TaxID=1073328 RepID=A0A1H2UL26_9FLAO|nr:alpha/beta fold hydrolase [Allomuricauda zhangzhouensis]SDQ16054.1 Acetyl esterase/lipase [Allomuricauda zhangzhouensis]SDW56822.1 Acetyl esterase/lipase [Allomuricauda zhangzhouensis]